MFDDISDKEYDDLKDWYAKGCHHIFAGILSAFLIMVITLLMLKELR
jgi:hypothetical protein